MSYKPEKANGDHGLIVEFLQNALPKEELDKLLEHIKKEKFLESVSPMELRELQNGVVSNLSAKRYGKDSDKLKEFITAAQKKRGLEPFVWSFSSDGTGAGANSGEHRKTIFEEFSHYCAGYQPNLYEYAPKKPIRFESFDLIYMPKKDIDWHLERFCRINKKPDAERALLSALLDEFRAKLPVFYSEAVMEELKYAVRDESSRQKRRLEQEKAKIDRAFKNRPGDAANAVKTAAGPAFVKR